MRNKNGNTYIIYTLAQSLNQFRSKDSCFIIQLLTMPTGLIKLGLVQRMSETQRKKKSFATSKISAYIVMLANDLSPLPVQFIPDRPLGLVSLNPNLHAQAKPDGRSVQSALLSQLSVLSAHSFISFITNK